MKYYPRVLIADDDAEVRNLLVAIVRNTLPAAQVTAVENGRMGLDFYRSRGADLVISNFMMPEMDGPVFVETLRRWGEEVPIIMVSGSPEAEALGREAGIDVFVPKHEIGVRLAVEIEELLGAERISCLNRYVTG